MKEQVNLDAGFSHRLGHCYALALKTVRRIPDASLVHGSIQHGEYPRNPHAWVELPDKRVYDPVLNHVFTPRAWTMFANPHVARRYTAEQAVALSVRERHWGPWHARPYGLEDD